MNILVCPDSFKDSLNSLAICEVLLNEIKNYNPSINVVSVPMADGGEGTLDVLNSQVGFERIEIESLDPIGRSIVTSYLWDIKSKTVVIEMAQASGIERLALEERNCMHTSTYGTGLQIVDAIENFSPKKIYLAVGSSATNDAGLGMLSAMGCDVIDFRGIVMDVPIGSDLINVSGITASETFSALVHGIDFIVVNDVDNPFSGKGGAAYTYAKQKGASPEEILILDEGLKVIRDIVIEDMDINLDKVTGAGAAGGIAGGAYAYLKATMISGTSFVSDITGLEDAIANADLIITGEGRLDHQTLQGKLVHHVSNLCMAHHKKMIVICGANDMNDDELDQLGNPTVYALNEYNHGAFTSETTKRDLKKVVKDVLKSL